MARPLKLLDGSNGRPRLDRYELIAELAAGGMATVFLARMGGFGGFQRFVAIKRLHAHFAHEQEFVEMFLDEARIAAGIHHPNVVPILEVGTSEAGYYLVMEYIEGGTLWDLREAAIAAGERVDRAVAYRVLLDSLAGLHAAHELKDESGRLIELVHRDVSPQNILVGVDGTARITDFGVARASTRLSSTRSGEIKGKLAYMAPEQVLAEPDIDRRADVFAMGVCLWEALTGQFLFRGGNDAATLNRVLREDIPDPRAGDRTVSAEVAQVVMAALDRDKAGRPATCADLARMIEYATRNEAVATPTAVASYTEALLGARLSERRESVRQWLASTPESSASARMSIAPPPAIGTGTLPPSSSNEYGSASFRGVAPGTVPPPAPIPARAPSVILPVAIAMVMTAVVAGGTVWFTTRSAPRPAQDPDAATASAKPPPVVTPSATAVPTEVIPVIDADDPPPPSASAAPSAAVKNAAKTGTTPGTTTRVIRPKTDDDMSHNPYQ